MDELEPMSALGNQSNLLIKLLTDHYYDAQWSKEHQGFRCVCSWLGESHVQHVAEVLTEAGFTPLAEPESLEDHLKGWAPGNLQHHLMFDHQVSEPVPYDGPLNQIHAKAHEHV